MARWTVEPDSRLATWVDYIAFSIDDEEVAPAPVRVIPDGRSDLLFSVEASGATTKPRARAEFPCAAEIFGIKTAPLLVSTTKRVENIALGFRPGAAKRFFDVPAHELTDRAHGVQEIWGREGRDLCSAIGGCARASDRKAVIETALLERLGTASAQVSARARAARTIAGSAVQAIVQSSGRRSVKDLCRIAACGERRLERIFREWVGTSPKQLSRIVRFQASREALDRGLSQVDVAHSLGYTDQSHLLRDFRALSGTTPGALFSRHARS